MHEGKKVTQSLSTKFDVLSRQYIVLVFVSVPITHISPAFFSLLPIKFFTHIFMCFATLKNCVNFPKEPAVIKESINYYHIISTFLCKRAHWCFSAERSMARYIFRRHPCNSIFTRHQCNMVFHFLASMADIELV